VGIQGDPGSGWFPDALVSWLFYPSEIQRNASIGADRNGTVHVAYEDYDPVRRRYISCVAGSTDGGMFWNDAFCAGSGFESFSHPSIAVNFTGGEALVVFEGSAGGIRWLKHFPHESGGILNLTTNPRDHNPSITISRDISANAFLAFERDDGAGGTDLMFMAARDRSVWEAWEMPQTLVGGFDHSVNKMPRVAWGPPNNVYIVYEREAASGNRDVFMMRSETGGTPGSWTFEPGTPVVATADDEFAPDVAAVLGSGTVVVPFVQPKGDYRQINVAYSEDLGNDSTWKVTPVTGEPLNHENPRVAAVPAVGAVRIVYWSFFGVFECIAPVSSLSSWRAPVRVTDGAARLTPEYNTPAIAAYPYEGKWYTGVVWTDTRNGLPNHDIYSSTNSPKLFFPSPDLAPVLIEILPNPPLSNNTIAQVNVTVANQANVSVGAFDLLLFDDIDGDMKPDAGENISLSQSVGIASFSQTNILLAWDASPDGNHTLCAFADPPPPKVNETNENNNVACAPVEVVSMPDYVPVSPLPPAIVKIGLSLPLQLSVRVSNQGDKNASATATVAFYNESSPSVPFAAFTVPPLNKSETSSRFTATWESPATPGTHRVAANVDYHDDIIESNETNDNYTWTIEAAAGPVTSLVIANPNYTSTATFVRSSTPLNLFVTDRSGSGINHTWYRIDNVTWTEYSSSFFLSGDGDRYVEWYSEDNVGNVENISWRVPRVDDTPPATAISIGEPKYLTGGNFVRSSTPLTLSATDGGVGSNSTFYRLWGGTWSPWREYSTSFNLAGRDGAWFVEFLSYDYLGNEEVIQNETLVLDNTPPVTTISPATGQYTPAIEFTLTAADSGCGVNITKYRIEGGSWNVYSGGFTLTEGVHNISYYSNDWLNNTEREMWLVVTVTGQPPGIAINYKPIIAFVFAISLLAAGLWSSKRKPWKGGKERMAVMQAFAIFSLPFVLAEAGTGIISLLTGLLSVPPLLGAGTAIDLAILVAGIVVAYYRIRKTAPRNIDSQEDFQLQC